MHLRKDRKGIVIANNAVANGIFEMTIAFDDWQKVIGGQFIHIQLPSQEKLMRRPFCICDYDEQAKTILVCYAVVGGGTQDMTLIKAGTTLNCMFPLGNGWEIPSSYNKIVLIGGGMGSAVLPAVITANRHKEYYTYLGFGNANKVVLEDLLASKSTSCKVATDDGSYGEKGFVTNIVANEIDTIKPDAIFCCGPEVMYKAFAKVMQGKNIPIFVSLEQRMGCGIGACLVCNCKIKRNGKEEYLRVCKDGPVFALEEVVL